MDKCLKSLKKAYGLLTKDEKDKLIVELEVTMRSLYFRAEEKLELINYLKEN